MSNIISPINILRKYWGYNSFRPLQEDIIKYVLAGNDTLALLPTGGGKSICFQVPALAKEGICLVVSPLIALMKDQVENLTKRGIKAISISGEKSKREIDYLLDNCIYGNVKFLYLSPERLKQELFLERFKKMNVNLIAIDEAHCISQWGYDFRPPYLEIKNLRKFHPNVPFLALTATATQDVVVDIQKKLDFKKEAVFRKSFYRDNLQYVVIKEEDSIGALFRVINNVNGSGIVYVKTRRETREIAQLLISQNISATFYNAGLSIEERTLKQKQWQENNVRIMVSTNAFGMGIDKPDVRFVVNLGLPESLEAYFQEAGRAGRDEKKSYGVLIVNKEDREIVKKNIEQKYPNRETIKKVYYAICNCLRIAIGSGQYLSYNINLKDVSNSFNIRFSEIIYSLPFLERAGYLSLSDNIKTHSTLRILLQGIDLYNFQVRNKIFDGLIKLLLRSYNGLFDGNVNIKEYEIGKRLNTSKKEIENILIKLHKLKVVDYKPSSNLPSITFLLPRVDLKHIRISKNILEDRKKLAYTKSNAVINYAYNTNTCRSVMLLKYFNDTTAKPCGKCDVCLSNRKKNTLSEKEFKIIEKKVFLEIKNKPIFIKDLIKVLSKNNKREDILFVVKWNIENGNISYDSNNQLILSQ